MFVMLGIWVFLYEKNLLPFFGTYCNKNTFLQCKIFFYAAYMKD
jgi:hypothetical protein